MAFLMHSVAVPVWVLILLIAGMLPLLNKLVKLLIDIKRGKIVREVQEDVVLWKFKNTKQSIAPKKSVSDIAREKRHDEKADIVHTLKILTEEGERGMLIQSIADRLNINIAKAQHAVAKLVDKKLVEEVVGMSGTKYYLTELGKNYCKSKGLN